MPIEFNREDDKKKAGLTKEEEEIIKQLRNTPFWLEENNNEEEEDIIFDEDDLGEEEEKVEEVKEVEEVEAEKEDRRERKREEEEEEDIEFVSTFQGKDLTGLDDRQVLEEIYNVLAVVAKGLEESNFKLERNYRVSQKNYRKLTDIEEGIIELIDKLKLVKEQLDEEFKNASKKVNDLKIEFINHVENEMERSANKFVDTVSSKISSVSLKLNDFIRDIDQRIKTINEFNASMTDLLVNLMNKSDEIMEAERKQREQIQKSLDRLNMLFIVIAAEFLVIILLIFFFFIRFK